MAYNYYLKDYKIFDRENTSFIKQLSKGEDLTHINCPEYDLAFKKYSTNYLNYYRALTEKFNFNSRNDINDIVLFLSDFIVKLFADDTTLIKTGDNLSELIHSFLESIQNHLEHSKFNLIKKSNNKFQEIKSMT
ncbi:hypothetical protein BpHYR1_024045 [Brachionus plicatilis]|uniref:Uncharacterized protein n=1 Tax=Brachionus plicatilis TaxID=10195 RepID=A0A3M7SJ22_BRAPC|nr:hypothetical protein BpHYR1_024045 [Brachionus plicatilis]